MFDRDIQELDDVDAFLWSELRHYPITHVAPSRLMTGVWLFDRPTSATPTFAVTNGSVASVTNARAPTVGDGNWDTSTAVVTTVGVVTDAVPDTVAPVTELVDKSDPPLIDPAGAEILPRVAVIFPTDAVMLPNVVVKLPAESVRSPVTPRRLPLASKFHFDWPARHIWIGPPVVFPILSVCEPAPPSSDKPNKAETTELPRDRYGIVPSNMRSSCVADWFSRARMPGPIRHRNRSGRPDSASSDDDHERLASLASDAPIWTPKPIDAANLK